MGSRKVRKTSVMAFAAISAITPISMQAAVSYNTNASPVKQGQTNGVNNPAETITFEGQGSLSKVIGSAAFGYLNLTGDNGTASITLDNGPGGTANTYSNYNTSTSAYLNLASQDFTAADTNFNNSNALQQTDSALRLEWHWNGTVDGSNDLINDQIGYNQTTGTVAPYGGNERGPTSANPVYVNGTNHFTGNNVGSGVNNIATLSTGFQLSQNTGLSTYNTYNYLNYNQAGNNLLGGTNRVQFSFSDYKTMDYSMAGTPSVYAAPGSAGYGNGNPAIPAAAGNLLGIGKVSAREAYQSGSIANMPTSNIDPGTVSASNPSGTAYAAGPWNTAGLDNISSTPVAANAVLIAANPGTGLSRLNKSDAQWIQTTGRLANGLEFNTVTRDADLGQRPTFATATGIDGTWAVGVNDGGDTTTTTNANLQHSLGSMKFSGKSADSEVYATIAQSRMGAGVLALTSTISATGNGPVRSLDIDFNDLSDPQLPSGGTDDSQFVSANLNTISTYQYQAVLLGYVTTIKSPNPTALAVYESANPGLTDAQAWAQMSSFNPSNASDGTVTGIKGDTTGDVAKFLDNLLNSQASYQTLTTANDPADAFLSNSYLLPNLLANSRNLTNGAITANPNYDAAGFAKAYAIYANKFNADYSGSFGKDTETTGSGSYYGAATGTVTSPAMNGSILITAYNADGSTAGDGVLAPRGNWLFGNFNQNGVRDLSAVESGLAAAKALWNVEPLGTTGANSAFNVSSGIANANNSTSVTYTDVTGNSHTMTKGDLIVMGDFLSTGRFDGASLVALAQGAASSDAVGTAGYTAGTLSGGQAGFADAVRSATLRKNDALAYMQTNTADASFNLSGGALNASAFLRQTGRAVLTEPGVTTPAGVPANAIALNSNDPNSGLEQFTYDALGVNAFNNNDVNRDGVVDFNDAVLVDQFNGQSYSSLTQQLTATEQAPVTGAIQSIDLANVQQIDGETSIGAADLALLNTGLSGVGNTNWYNYSTGALIKSGPGTISWNRTRGAVTVYTGAALQISSGAIHVNSAIDPFTDSTTTGTNTSTGSSVAVTVTGGGTLEYIGQSTNGVQLDRLASLNISTGGVVMLDSNTLGGRNLLIVGSLSLVGKLDLGNNVLDIQTGTTLATLSDEARLGTDANLDWNASRGLTSAAAFADTSHLTAVGVIQNNQSGSALFTSSRKFDQIIPGAGDLLAKYTYYGDANLDGTVDGSDYSLIDSGYQEKLTGWFNGDFNYDGVVNGSDYTLMDNAFNSQGTALTAQIGSPNAIATDQIAGATSAVPEPVTTGWITFGFIGLLGRRRRSGMK